MTNVGPKIAKLQVKPGLKEILTKICDTNKVLSVKQDTESD